jgi:DNA-binding MarR family transcriptional regulator
MIEMRRLSGAPITMRQKGMETDAVVLQRIYEKPGITVHEIADRLGWTNGKVDGSINRLHEKGKVRVEHFIRRRTLIKKVYSTEEKRRLPSVIEIPKEEIAENTWRHEAHIYSLSRSSIAISPVKSDEWEKKALWKGTTALEDKGEKLLVRLPEELSSFYRLENSEISLSTSDDFALVNVESTIVPVELPPSYPETPILRKTRYIVFYEKIEQVGATSPFQDAAFYGKYPLGEEVSISRAGLSEAEINTLFVKKKEKERSVTSQELETPVQVIVR